MVLLELEGEESASKAGYRKCLAWVRIEKGKEEAVFRLGQRPFAHNTSLDTLRSEQAAAMVEWLRT